MGVGDKKEGRVADRLGPRTSGTLRESEMPRGNWAPGLGLLVQGGLG